MTRCFGLREYPVVAGDGIGRYCLGFTRQQLGCPDEGPCRSINKGTDVFFDAEGRASRIRVHRTGRWPQIPEQNAPWVSDTHIVLGKPFSWLPHDLPRPQRTEARDDPEFGRIKVWHFPGLEVEFDSNAAGETVVGGMVVKRK
ncbi:MAG: hypothetical protein R3B13_05535 [Polyangiaceae bacterium]